MKPKIMYVLSLLKLRQSWITGYVLELLNVRQSV